MGQYKSQYTGSQIDNAVKKTFEIKNIRKYLRILSQIVAGNTWDFDTDTGTTYVKTVPSGAYWGSVDSIGGRSVVRNQLSENGNFNSSTGWTFAVSGYTFSVSNNAVSIENVSATNHMQFVHSNIDYCIAGHVYYACATVKKSIIGDMQLYFLSPSTLIATISGATDTWIFSEGIATPSSAGTRFGLYASNTNFPVGSTCEAKDIYLVDLTKWFGAGNEPSSTSDVRLEEVRSYLATHPDEDTGTLISAAVTSVDVADSNSTVTETVNIPSAIRLLTGYGWSAGTARNWVDYANGKYHQEVAAIDLATVSWSIGDGSNDRFYGIIPSIKPCSSSVLPNMISEKYRAIKWSDGLSNNHDGIARHNDDSSSYVFLYKGEGTPTPSGMLYYELDTPVDTDISEYLTDGFLENMPVEAGGSITFVNADEVAANVQTTYIVKLDET